MSIVFEDIFEVVQLNNGGKKYEKINRLTCKGNTSAPPIIPPLLLLTSMSLSLHTTSDCHFHSH